MASQEISTSRLKTKVIVLLQARIRQIRLSIWVNAQEKTVENPILVTGAVGRTVTELLLKHF